MKSLLTPALCPQRRGRSFSCLSRFRLSQVAPRRVRGRLFLARLSEARDEAAQQLGLLAEEIRQEQGRDRLVTRALRQSGWRVLRIWEHELARKNETRLVRRIQTALTLH